MNEMFDSDVFKESYKKLFEKDANDELKMGSAARLECFVSKDLKICGAIGNCTSLKKGGPSVSEIEIGQGGTSAWYMGGIDRCSTQAIYLDL